LELLPFEVAREFVHKLGLKSSKEWAEYCKSGNKPSGIPHSPYRAYKNHWKGWSDWLGSITPREMPRRTFEKAREFVHSLKLKNKKVE